MKKTIIKITIGSLMLLLSLQHVSANSDSFVKYKNYLIPIITPLDSGNGSSNVPSSNLGGLNIGVFQATSYEQLADDSGAVGLPDLIGPNSSDVTLTAYVGSQVFHVNGKSSDALAIAPLSQEAGMRYEVFSGNVPDWMRLEDNNLCCFYGLGNSDLAYFSLVALRNPANVGNYQFVIQGTNAAGLTDQVRVTINVVNGAQVVPPFLSVIFPGTPIRVGQILTGNLNELLFNRGDRVTSWERLTDTNDPLFQRCVTGYLEIISDGDANDLLQPIPASMSINLLTGNVVANRNIVPLNWNGCFKGTNSAGTSSGIFGVGIL